MAKDRIEPCKYYICAGQCDKGRNADHHGYCQKCGKYIPRIRKKQSFKLQRILKRSIRMIMIGTHLIKNI